MLNKIRTKRVPLINGVSRRITIEVVENMRKDKLAR